MIMECFKSHVWKPESSFFGAFVTPIKYPSFPFPRISNLTNWDHLRKFSPFSLWVVICSEGLSLVPWGKLEMKVLIPIVKNLQNSHFHWFLTSNPPTSSLIVLQKRFLVLETKNKRITFSSKLALIHIYRYKTTLGYMLEKIIRRRRYNCANNHNPENRKK